MTPEEWERAVARFWSEADVRHVGAFYQFEAVDALPKPVDMRFGQTITRIEDQGDVVAVTLSGGTVETGSTGSACAPWAASWRALSSISSGGRRTTSENRDFGRH